MDDKLAGRSNNMSGIIHFVSGKTLDIDELEFSNIAPKLQGKGIKCQRSQAGHIIPLNSSTIEFIEHVVDELPSSVEVNGEILEVVKKEPKEEAKDPMEDMIAKSNCTHENQSLYLQKTAKGDRYFPVCDFCGKRERYVSEKKVLDGEYEDWKAEDIENAIPWTE